MNITKFLSLFIAAMAFAIPCRASHTSWEGKNVVFLGDSITDKCHVGCKTNYWGFLEQRMKIKPFVYGLNGWAMDGIPLQAARAHSNLTDRVDAVFIFAGTNDFNGGVPLGKAYEEKIAEVNKGGAIHKLMKREFSFDKNTFHGRLNLALKSVKEYFPKAQIVLMTPLHRGYAAFSATNVQPDERYANWAKLYISDYVQAVKEAGLNWSVCTIDLYGEANFLPNMATDDELVANKETDRLHPSTAGHDRIARLIEMKMRSIPSSLK